MKFKIPFTLLPVEELKRKAKPFRSVIQIKKRSFHTLEENLKAASVPLSKEEYLAICYRTAIFSFIFSSLIAGIAFFFFIKDYYPLAALVPFAFVVFIFFKQISYPKIFMVQKMRDIERNLIPAMQDILVQLNSGVPLFDILVNISRGDYGEVSKEFIQTVKEINTGRPQIEVLDELGERNSSLYFRRVLWQISNGMRAGSDMSVVIKEGIESLNKEQVIQIQNYGSRLNPIIMFYMLMVIIIPSLAITFFIIVSSMIKLGSTPIMLFFIFIFIGVTLLQVLFLGMVRTRRPSLI